MPETPLGPYPVVAIPKEPIVSISPWGAWFAKIRRLVNIPQVGTVTFAGAGSALVTFARVEPDPDYVIVLGGNVNETFWWTSKTVNGFTARSSNAGSTAILNYGVSR